MWTFIEPVKLVRYLLVWRVNSSLVRLPRCLSAELSLVLGSLIADRLPTPQARLWHKALSPWDEYGGLALIGSKKPPTIPQVSWPLEAVLFTYPGKSIYGQGEPILWELKLLGESADHGLFLELLLPAIEDAGSRGVSAANGRVDSTLRRQNCLWGHFDLPAVYVARGRRWEPLVQDGRLDLSYRATPTQWAEGLSFDLPSRGAHDTLTWLTPFDLEDDEKPARGRPRQTEQAPTLQQLLAALVARMSHLLPGKHHTPDDVWSLLSAEEQAALQKVMKQAALIPVHHTSLKPPPNGFPGRRLGRQTFASIPTPLIPYLELASIVHIGRQTHLGCGTFVVM